MNTQLKSGLLLLGGVFLGLVAGVVGGWLLVRVLDKESTVGPLPPLPAYDMEVIIEETYINRVMLESSNALTAGNVDMQPGGAATFGVQLAAGPFKPVARGAVAFRADGAGGMAVQLLHVKMGRLSLLRLVPGSVMDEMNDIVNTELVGRVGSKGLEVVAVASDETSLRLYLAQRE
ncbi:MAG: hypothetical protein JW892_11960 [Anaerolineae bacterium]|nr:hypothetical protein [Anaerolineae bacterium]